jgi:hypothetical protein
MVNGESFHNAKIEIEGGIKKKKNQQKHIDICQDDI